MKKFALPDIKIYEKKNNKQKSYITYQGKDNVMSKTESPERPTHIQRVSGTWLN